MKDYPTLLKAGKFYNLEMLDNSVVISANSRKYWLLFVDHSNLNNPYLFNEILTKFVKIEMNYKSFTDRKYKQFWNK
jgi:hypothetical protein